MKPGAAFEMIEEDLFFPGQSGSDIDEDDVADDQESVVSEESKDRSSTGRDDNHRESIPPTSAIPAIQGADAPSMSTSHSLPISGLTDISLPPALTLDRLTNSTEGATQSSTSINSTKTVTSFPSYPPNGTPTLPSQYDDTAVKVAPPKKGRSSRPSSSSSKLGIGNSSIPSIMSAHNSPAMGNREPIAFFVSTSLPAALHPGQVATQTSPRLTASATEGASGPPKPQGDVFLLRAMSKPLGNPRDHSLLNKIYREMHSSRFINLNPLSILANSLGLYLKDVRTHPPLQFFFPPTEALLSDQSSEAVTDSSDTEDPSGSQLHRSGRDIADVALAASPYAKRRRSSTAASYTMNLLGVEEEDHYLSMRDLMQEKSQYVKLDESRTAGFAPSTRPGQHQRFRDSGKPRDTSPSASFHPMDGFAESMDSIANHTNHMLTRSRLPNETLRFDVRTLNLHLAMRVAEILACSEAMWEWVVEFQRQRKQKRAADEKVAARRSRAGSLAGQGDTRANVARNPAEQKLFVIEQLSRSDFDELLFNFKLDMREQAILGGVLEDRFGWTSLPSNPLEQDIFDKACEKWEEYLIACREQEQLEQETRRLHYPDAKYRKHRNSSSSNITELPTHSSTSHALSESGRPLSTRPTASASSTNQPHSLPAGQRRSPEKLKLSRAMRVFVAWKEG